MLNNEAAAFYNKNLIKAMITDLDLVEFFESFEDEEKFSLLINIVVQIIEDESEFFMLKDKFAFRIISIISEHYQSCEKSLQNVLDSLYEFFKKILNISFEDKAELISNYKFNYENIIGFSVDDDSFLTYMSNDAYLMKALIYDKVEEIEVNELTILSLDYILYKCPDFFIDPVINSKTLLLFDKIFQLENLLPEFEYNAREIKKDIQKVLKRDE